MLTIISGAGIMVLVSIPILVLGGHWDYSDVGDVDLERLAGVRALALTLLVLGVTMTGALAMIVIRLADRYLRG